MVSSLNRLVGGGGAHLRHRISRTGIVRDLRGVHRGGAVPWNPITTERMIAERIAFSINGILRRKAPELRADVIRDRMSAPHIQIGRGKYLQKNPKRLGCRRIDGDLQDSVRITITTPGTNANRFRGVFRLSSKCGGSRAPHGGIQEAAGRLQFREYTTAKYVPIIEEIRAAVAQIVAQFGGTVS